MKTKFPGVAAGLAILLALAATLAWLNPAGLRAESAALTQELVIVGAGGERHRFNIEFAADENAKMRGLMFRKSLPPDGGMLFDFAPEQSVEMWMKNTFIPLDIIFIGADGRIRNIHERAVPHDTSLIASKGRVRAVLELNGGTADRLGLRPGDLVLHALFPAAGAGR